MKPMKLLLILMIFFCAAQSNAQIFTAAELKDLRVRQDSLKQLAFKIVNDQSAAVRFRSDSAFTKIIVRALLKKNSFQFPFDSLLSISRMYSEDSVFRIFTWQVVKDDNYCRQRGFIQLKTKDGSLKLFPLRDVSEFTQAPVDTIANNMGWIGAIYYRIVLKQHEGRNYYTLFGYDENNMRTTRKWMDILWFDELGAPVFGKQNAFSFATDSIPKPPVNRFLLEYKKDARARVQYDEEAGIIIYDHLISESNELQKKYTLIPDGDYEGFEWKNGQWLHIDKVFNFKLKDGEAPAPVPFTDEKLPLRNPTAKPPIKKKPGGGS
jgi:hypothetical protein